MEAKQIVYGGSSESVDSERARRQVDCKKASEWMVKCAAEAISLEANHAAEIEHAARLLGRLDTNGYDLAIERAKRIHVDRCRSIQRMAKFARMAVCTAQGSLMISQSTSHTGLDEEDRIAVEQVSGCIERF
jgi:hypothetical protein